MKRIAIILSQEFERFLPADATICADGGYDVAQKNKIKVDLLVGDMDSISKIPTDVNIMTAPCEKDFSDGEFALRQAMLMGAHYVDIYGAWGGRPDHSLYNLHLLALAYSLGMEAVIRADKFDVYYFEKSICVSCIEGDTISIVPFGCDVHIIKAKGLKYPADNIVLTKNDTLGLSNVALSKNIFVSIEKGSALIIRNF